ncbi:hypothetical protein AAY473_002343 [Plecturocebus cupreus]
MGSCYIAQANLELLPQPSSCPASQSIGTIGMSHYTWSSLLFSRWGFTMLVRLVSNPDFVMHLPRPPKVLGLQIWESHYVVQAGLEFLVSSDPLSSASQSVGTTGMSQKSCAILGYSLTLYIKSTSNSNGLYFPSVAHPDRSYHPDWYTLALAAILAPPPPHTYPPLQPESPNCFLASTTALCSIFSTRQPEDPVKI